MKTQRQKIEYQTIEGSTRKVRVLVNNQWYLCYDTAPSKFGFVNPGDFKIWRIHLSDTDWIKDQCLNEIDLDEFVDEFVEDIYDEICGVSSAAGEALEEILGQNYWLDSLPQYLPNAETHKYASAYRRLDKRVLWKVCELRNNKETLKAVRRELRIKRLPKPEQELWLKFALEAQEHRYEIRATRFKPPVTTPRRWIEYWPTRRLSEYQRRISSVMSPFHSIVVTIEDLPRASGQRIRAAKRGYETEFRRRYSISVTGDWMTKCRRLGTNSVEGQLVLDVLSSLKTTQKNAEAYKVLLVRQGRGGTLHVEKCAIWRQPGQPWMKTTSTTPSLWDYILDEDTEPRAKKPVRRTGTPEQKST